MDDRTAINDVFNVPIMLIIFIFYNEEASSSLRLMKVTAQYVEDVFCASWIFK